MKSKYSHGGNYPPSRPNALEAIDIVGRFDYLFPAQAADPDCLLDATDTDATIAALKALGNAMIEPSDTPAEDSNIPPIYTYWGQFIDHDITASDFGTLGSPTVFEDSFSPADPNDVKSIVKNRRRPILDLDSIYGDGPDGEAAHFYDGQKFKIGTCTDIGSTPDPQLGLMRDLPRHPNDTAGVVFSPDNEPSPKQAVIGDGRNDENLIIAQFHTGMLRFHNAVVDWVEANEGLSGRDAFWRANQLTRFHYQWLVVHDYLRSITQPGLVDKVLYGDNRFFTPPVGDVFMPLEFAGAVYRFGHSQVRGRYDWNVNFGRPDGVPGSSNRATFDQMFIFTGGGDFFGLPTLPTNWIADWPKMTDHNSPFKDRFARKIDTNLAIFLNNLFKDVAETDKMLDEQNLPALTAMQREIVKHLAVRNLLRGYLLSLPTGQHIADAMGVARLSSAELQQNNAQAVNDALAAGGFLDRTPLWYYILKEAEVRADGNALGDVGGRIVAETLVGLLKADANSFVNAQWTPSRGVKFANGDPITTILDVFKFAGTAVQ